MKIFITWLHLVSVIWMVGGERENVRRSSVGRRTIYSEPKKSIPGPEKNYTGIRVKTDSLLMVYYHEQTVAVVEVSESRDLFNCELLEVRTKLDQQVALGYLRPNIPSQIKIKFKDMLHLMSQCQKLEFPWNLEKTYVGNVMKEKSGTTDKQLTSLVSGVFPGTKWCGAGDLAGSYHDLGPDKILDKCCRTHDLCPVKVMGFRTQYDITNYSFYTKSHCECDDMFYGCLKSVGSTAADFLGNIYFNIAQANCVEDVPSNLNNSSAKRFASRNKKY